MLKRKICLATPTTPILAGVLIKVFQIPDPQTKTVASYKHSKELWVAREFEFTDGVWRTKGTVGAEWIPRGWQCWEYASFSAVDSSMFTEPSFDSSVPGQPDKYKLPFKPGCTNCHALQIGSEDECPDCGRSAFEQDLERELADG